jgi:hypothetical protein
VPEGLAREKLPEERIPVGEVWKHNGRPGRPQPTGVTIACDAHEMKAQGACGGQVPQGIADAGNSIDPCLRPSRSALEGNL